MGNCDLCIVFNGEIAFIVLGTQYETHRQAINLAMNYYTLHIDSVKEVADFPEQIEGEIKKIEIVEIVRGKVNEF